MDRVRPDLEECGLTEKQFRQDAEGFGIEL